MVFNQPKVVLQLELVHFLCKVAGSLADEVGGPGGGVRDEGRLGGVGVGLAVKVVVVVTVIDRGRAGGQHARWGKTWRQRAA